MEEYDHDLQKQKLEIENKKLDIEKQKLELLSSVVKHEISMTDFSKMLQLMNSTLHQDKLNIITEKAAEKIAHYGT